MGFKTNALTSSLIFMACGALFTVHSAQADTQNEVQAVAVDIEGVDDALFGANYIRYFESINNKEGAYLINPYLQRVSSVTGGYYNIENSDIYNLGGTFYFDEKWMLSVEGSHAEFNDNFDNSDLTVVDVRGGFNLSRQWQIGAGLVYQRASYDSIGNDVAISDSESDTSPIAFTRYTLLSKYGTGWDLMAQYIADDVDNLDISARYFFSPGLSVAGTYSYVNAPDGVDDEKVVGVEVDYWMSDKFALKLAHEFDVDSNIDSDVTMLRASYRF